MEQAAGGMSLIRRHGMGALSTAPTRKPRVTCLQDYADSCDGP